MAALGGALRRMMSISSRGGRARAAPPTPRRGPRRSRAGPEESPAPPQDPYSVPELAGKLLLRLRRVHSRPRARPPRRAPGRRSAVRTAGASTSIVGGKGASSRSCSARRGPDTPGGTARRPPGSDDSDARDAGVSRTRAAIARASAAGSSVRIAAVGSPAALARRERLRDTTRRDPARRKRERSGAPPSPCASCRIGDRQASRKDSEFMVAARRREARSH